MVCEEKMRIFHYDCIFTNIPRKKNQNIIYIFLNHSVNEKKIIFLVVENYFLQWM